MRLDLFRPFGWCILAVILSGAVFSQTTLAQEPATASVGSNSPQLPSAEQLLVLVRTTMIALNQANITVDYSVLYALCAPALQQKASVEDMAASFEALRKRGIDFSAVAILTPQVTEQPLITSNGILAIRGVFETKPLPLSFTLGFVAVAGVWRIETLSVTVAPDAADNGR